MNSEKYSDGVLGALNPVTFSLSYGLCSSDLFFLALSFAVVQPLEILPPRPKLVRSLGAPKPLLAGKLVDGQESASQGRPGSPAFSRPGRLGWRGEEREMERHAYIRVRSACYPKGE